MTLFGCLVNQLEEDLLRTILYTNNILRRSWRKEVLIGDCYNEDVFVDVLLGKTALMVQSVASLPGRQKEQEGDWSGGQKKREKKEKEEVDEEEEEEKEDEGAEGEENEEEDSMRRSPIRGKVPLRLKKRKASLTPIDHTGTAGTDEEEENEVKEAEEGQEVE
ncbi:unnamed protein product [Heligmosomoides polygyrus]|uniref:Prothymosin alpha-like n=1 Tax=Heligmosomoides polygyrus TaxID=6339 RepID=A0A3P8BE56_HELPZ|nr:unnamed protein product [Heligmosomoides polygyrus]